MIELPTELRAALDEALAPYAPRALAVAADDLSATYRRAVTSARPSSHAAIPVGEDPAEEAAYSPASPPMSSLAVAAYAATRLPATFAAVAAALTQARLRRPDWRPQSLLDAGAGMGAALWAALAAWPDLAHATLLERDPQMIALGRRLAAASPVASQAEWRQLDLRAHDLWGDAGDMSRDVASNEAVATSEEARRPRRNIAGDASVTDRVYDLVMAAYVLSELRAPEREELVAHLWRATGGALALVAPGTPIGFAQIRAARTQLIAAGATILAPCPHDGACPMCAGAVATDDWCHFAQRLARSRLHRQIKGGDLAYEDEKFSYVIAARPSNPAVAPTMPTTPIGGRIVRHPQTRPGLVALEVCAPGGLERRIVTRKDRDAYRQARDLRWGDAVN